MEPQVGDTPTRTYTRSEHEYPAVPWGESVIRLSLGRRLVDLLPEAQRTNTLTYYSTPGRMQLDCGSWIRWWVSRIRNCADMIGWERDEVQRTAKRCGDDGHGKYVRLRLLLVAAVNMAARAPPSPTNEQTSNDKDKRHGAKILAALCRETIRSSIVCFQPVNT